MSQSSGRQGACFRPNKLKFAVLGMISLHMQVENGGDMTMGRGRTLYTIHCMVACPVPTYVQ